ncbi:MAG: hypothetical protein ACI4ME_04430 [Aristaeellaceae bacterium]
MRKLVSALQLVCTAFAQGAEVNTEGLFSYVLTEKGTMITAFAGADPCPEEIGMPADPGGNPHGLHLCGLGRLHAGGGAGVPGDEAAPEPWGGSDGDD